MISKNYIVWYNYCMKTYCLITGATGGLGNAFAKQLVDQHNLILTGTKQERIEAFKSELLKINPNCNIVCKACNFKDMTSRQEFYDFVKTNKLHIDMLINNAGLMTEGDILSAPSETLLDAIKINCEATVELTKFVLDTHKKGDKLDILTVSSFSGFNPIPHMAVYSATKSFLYSFFYGLHHEVKKQGIKVSVAMPSGIYTTAEMKKAIASQGLGGKLSSMSPEKIAKISLKGLAKNKKIIIPGFFNKLTYFVCKIMPTSIVVSYTDKRWQKSQSKRGM